jgi:hypothetical protein
LALRVTGKFKPLIEKVAPVTFACEMVTDDPPVLVTVSDRFALLPTCTLPIARLLGFGDSVPGVTPVPESAMLRLGFNPFDVIVTLPLAAPLALGANCTVNEVLWPAVKVKGKDRPLNLNPAPLALAAEMVRLDPPELVNVSDKLELLPTCTLPNARLVGLAVSDPCATPVPERGMVRSELLPVDVMLMLPLSAPVAVGAKTTVNDVLWPAVKVNGKDSPLRLNPVPLAVAAEIVRLVPPLLVRVSVSDFEAPTCTLPKARLVGLGVKAPCATPVPESGMLRLGTEPVAVMLTLPLAAPVAEGEKRTVNEVLWPAFKVKGKDSPLKLNPVPLALAAEMVRLLPPEFVRVPLSDFEVPTWMFPKLKLVGLDPN